MKIRAAVFHDESLNPSIEELDLSGPNAGEVLVRVTATGVCHTDLKVAGPGGRSPRPVVLGHEGAGVVEAVGPGVSSVEPGDHVVMSFDSCGHCPSCLDAEPAYCYTADHFACTRENGEFYLSANGTPIHGDFFNQSSFATHAIGKESGIVKVRKDAPLELLGPLGCGIQTGAGAVLNVFKMKPGQTIAIFGVGSLGLSALMAAKISGASRIIAVDLHPSRLQLAAELGAHEMIEAGDGPVADRVLKLMPDGVDFALDTTAVAPVMRQAVEVLAPRGAFGFVAAPLDGSELSLSMRPIMKGRKILGITEGNSNPKVFIPRLVDFFMQGQFPFDRLTRFYPFDDIAQAFHDSESGAAVKPILRMN
jgi:aryl-alcohol dehydrogenase